MEEFTTGMIAMACGVAALFFLRFWKRTHDRLFLIFAIAFAVMAVTRIALMNLKKPDEYMGYAYTFRLATYLLILAAIFDKNRPR